MRIPKQDWQRASLHVHPSNIHGRGTFSREPIKRGETVIIFGGTVFSKADIDAGKANNRTLMQIGEDSWLGSPADKPLDDDYYLNHSCDPNLWMKDEVTLVARRNIASGEEVTMDYSTHFANPDWTMKGQCNCSSGQCRHIITGKDWMLEDLQKRYGSHFSPLLNRRIAVLRDG